MILGFLTPELQIISLGYFKPLHLFVTGAVGNRYSQSTEEPTTRGLRDHLTATQPRDHALPLGQRNPCFNHITVQCARACVCFRVHVQLHTCPHRRRPEEEGRMSKLSSGHQALGLDGPAGQAVLYSLHPSLLRASGEMLSSGTQKGRNVTGAQLTPGDPAKTKQIHAAETQESKKKRERERAN